MGIKTEQGDDRRGPDGKQLLDLVFLEARAKLIDIAGILDRIDRYGGAEDYRLRAFYRALEELSRPGGGDRARRVLTTFSDPTDEPVDSPLMHGATGAWPGGEKE